MLDISRLRWGHAILAYLSVCSTREVSAALPGEVIQVTSLQPGTRGSRFDSAVISASKLPALTAARTEVTIDASATALRDDRLWCLEAQDASLRPGSFRLRSKSSSGREKRNLPYLTGANPYSAVGEPGCHRLFRIRRVSTWPMAGVSGPVRFSSSWVARLRPCRSTVDSMRSARFSVA